MKKKFSELTPKELLEVKEDVLLEKDPKADLTRACEVSEECAQKLYNDPNYPSRAELLSALVEAYKKYPWKTSLKGTFVTDSNGNRTFKYVPDKK